MLLKKKMLNITLLQILVSGFMYSNCVLRKEQIKQLESGWIIRNIKDEIWGSVCGLPVCQNLPVHSLEDDPHTAD